MAVTPRVKPIVPRQVNESGNKSKGRASVGCTPKPKKFKEDKMINVQEKKPQKKPRQKQEQT